MAEQVPMSEAEIDDLSRADLSKSTLFDSSTHSVSRFQRALQQLLAQRDQNRLLIQHLDDQLITSVTRLQTEIKTLRHESSRQRDCFAAEQKRVDQLSNELIQQRNEYAQTIETLKQETIQLQSERNKTKTETVRLMTENQQLLNERNVLMATLKHVEDEKYALGMGKTISLQTNVEMHDDHFADHNDTDTTVSVSVSHQHDQHDVQTVSLLVAATGENGHLLSM